MNRKQRPKDPEEERENQLCLLNTRTNNEAIFEIINDLN